MCRRCSPPNKTAAHVTLAALSSPNDLRVRLLNPDAHAGAGTGNGKCSCRPRLLSLLPRAGGCIAAVCGVGLLAATAWHIVHRGADLPDTRIGASGPTTIPGTSHTCAREIWVIRHGEGPPESGTGLTGPGTGLTASRTGLTGSGTGLTRSGAGLMGSRAGLNGSGTGLGLSDTGAARAVYLRDLVESGAWPSFALIFASDPTPPSVEREFATVLPLAEALGVRVNTSFSKGEGDALAAAALEAARTWVPCGGTVLISWEHCRMPQLLQALGCVVAQCEQCWPDGRYDRVERLEVGDSISAYLGHAAEGFAADNDGFGGDYECVDADHVQDTDCWLPDGRHVGHGTSEPRYRGMVHSG